MDRNPEDNLRIRQCVDPAEWADAFMAESGWDAFFKGFMDTHRLYMWFREAESTGWYLANKIASGKTNPLPISEEESVELLGCGEAPEWVERFSKQCKHLGASIMFSPDTMIRWFTAILMQFHFEFEYSKRCRLFREAALLKKV